MPSLVFTFALIFCAITQAIEKQEKNENLGEMKMELSKDNTESRLIGELLSGYNKFAHPKSYFKTNLNFTVVFGIEIVHLVAVEDRNQRIITNCWVRQQWTNPALRWKPSDYNNITKIRISGEKVWIPDILLYNSADTQKASGGLHKYHTLIIIDHEGRHYWYTPTSFISTCKINVKYFPFDRQRCIMKFGSWTFQMNDLDIVGDLRPIVTSQYLKSAEWDLVSVHNERNSITYACCEFPFSDLTIILVISRRPLFFIFNLMIPCFIIIAMVLMGFLLPPESGERTTLSITVLLAMAVFLQLQAEHLPRNSEEIPLLGIFYLTVMAEVGLSLMATCYVLNIYHKNSGVHIVPMHPFVSKFFLGTMAPLLRISPPTHEWSLTAEPDVERLHPTTARRNDGVYPKTQSDTEVHLLHKTSGEKVDTSERLYNGTPGVVLRSSSRSNTRPHSCSPSKRSLIHSLSSSVTHLAGAAMPRHHDSAAGVAQTCKGLAHCCSILAENMKTKRAIRLDQERWKYLAMVLDRIFFLLFLITILSSSFFIYYQVDTSV